MTDLITRVQGRAGRITLNRPKALNALTWDMIRGIDAALSAWQDDDAVDLVIIDGAGDRAFAAGGDIVDLYTTGRAGDFAYGQRFWAEEYRLNARIAGYAKPFVALMHGFVMGGGVGVSCHGSHRIVGETAQIAMPECGIGLIPDIGGSWILARTPVGAFVGLTGYRMGPADAIFAGFADSYVPQSKWPALIETLCQTGSVAAIAEASETAPDGVLTDWSADLSAWIDAPDMGAVLRQLDALGTETAAKHAKTLRRQSPLSIACGLAAIRSAAQMTLTEALAQEYRYVSRCMQHGDFLEGIRAQVIDKDRMPKWRHASVEEVSAAEVDAMLAPLGDDELKFD